MAGHPLKIPCQKPGCNTPRECEFSHLLKYEDRSEPREENWRKSAKGGWNSNRSWTSLRGNRPLYEWHLHSNTIFFKEMFAIKIFTSKRQQPLFQNQVPNFCHDNEQPFQSKLNGWWVNGYSTVPLYSSAVHFFNFAYTPCDDVIFPTFCYTHTHANHEREKR